MKNPLIPPHFDDLEQDFQARFIHGFAWIALVFVTIITLITAFTGYSGYTLQVLIALLLILILTLMLLYRHMIRASAILLIALSWSSILFQAFTSDGIHDVIIMAFIAVALFASIVIGLWAGGAITLATIVAAWILAALESAQIIQPIGSPPLIFARDLTFIVLIISTLIYFSTKNLQAAIERTTESERKLSVSNQEIHKINISLEDRIAESTSELVQTNRRNERRAKQFEAISQVARVIASIQDLDSLLPRITEVISEQFGFYHVGIFMWDEKREYAELVAANSDGGQKMLKRGHRLAIGQTGIVGFVAATGAPRVALDVGADAVYFDNPELPKTRSELALPLRIATEVIGVLDVQSVEQNAFQDEDSIVLSTLADQVAIAIQNGLSYEKTQSLLREAQQASGAYIQDAWKLLQSQHQQIGYMLVDDSIKPLTRTIQSAAVEEAMHQQVTVTQNGENAVIAIPIQLRNDVIGVMEIKTADEHDWETDELDIIQAVADRLSLALETSLLLRTTQRRAQIERATSEISGRISSSTQFDAILRTAAEELSQILGGSEVIVQIQPGALE